MRRTLSSLSTGVGNVVSGVGTISAAVSTTMLNIATEDQDLEGFEEPQFASDLQGRLDKELLSKKSRKKQRDKEVSVDSGVATDPLETGVSRSRENSSNSSSLSLSSVEDEFLQGLSFVETGKDLIVRKHKEDDFISGLNFQDPWPYVPNQMMINNMLNDNQQDRGSCSSAETRDEITHVTDDEDILTPSSHASESGDVAMATSEECDDVMMTSSDEDEEFSLGTVDITATEVFLARKRTESAESRHHTRSLNHSGNLSDLRRSTNDLSVTPRPLSNTQRSKSTLTLSPLSDESTCRLNSSFDTVKSRSEAVLNTILEREDMLRERDNFAEGVRNNNFAEERSVQYNNFVEVSHHDPTTIESFDSSSGDELSQYQDSHEGFDADEDLMENKDPFRESFTGGSAGVFAAKVDESGPVSKNIPAPKHDLEKFSPMKCVKRKTLHNFNVGPGLSEIDDSSVIETISEISHRSQKSCTIARKSQVRLKPLPKINAHQKSTNIPKPKPSNENSLQLSNRLSHDSSTSSKRKNHLKPPSQTSQVQKDTKYKESPRSLTQRSNSWTTLNSKTEEPLTRSGTLDGFNSLDKTRSYADVTYTPGNFSTESSPTVDQAEGSLTAQHSNLQPSPDLITSSGEDLYRGRSGTETSSSTFYSFSTEEQEPPKVILNGKTSKSFMTSMRNSFKKLASFLTLSRRQKESSMKHPVPPPQHTKPDQAAPVVGKYRQCVRPSSPSLAREFSQRSKSCGNLQKKMGVVGSSPGEKYKCMGDVDEEQETKVTKPRASAPLITHITGHYNKQGTSNSRQRGSAALGASTRAGSMGAPSRGARGSTPALYQSSPGALLPSPPSQRKPLWRETKASRLRLNRVKVPGSMNTLNL